MVDVFGLLCDIQVLVIDLCYCMGGDLDMVMYFVSYLFDQFIYFNDVYWCDENCIEVCWISVIVFGFCYGQ